MNKILSGILIIFTVFQSYSQTFEWLRAVQVDYNYNPEMINYSIALDGEENSYLFGTKQHEEFYNGSYGQLSIEKYDSDGNPIWVNNIYGLGMTKGSVCDLAGNLYIIGNHRSALDFWGDDSLSYSGNTINSYFAKIKADGSLEWAINLNTLYPDIADVNDIKADENGNILLGISGSPYSYITVFSPEGLILTEIVQSKAGISGIDIDGSGNIVTTGSCSSSESLFGGINHVTPFGYSMYLALYDPDGDPQWVEFAEDVTCIYPKVSFDEDGNIFWTGSLHIQSVFGGIQSGGPDWVYDFFLVKVNPSGNFEWIFEVPPVSGGDALAGKISPIDFTPEGNVILGGFSRGSVDWGNDVISVSNNYYDLIVLEINSQGIAQWAKTAGGNYYDNVHALAVSEMGNIYIAGIAGDTVNFDTITYQSDQIFYPFVAKIDNENITGIEHPEIFDHTLTFYPNPAKDFIHIQQDNLKLVRIYNAMGIQIKEITLDKSQQQVNISDLSTGIYFTSATGNDGVIYQGRFLKR